jgi:hypothetical protein
MVGPRIVMLFADVDHYYDYIDRFYPDSGEFGGSGGICVTHDYFHVVVGPGDFGRRQSTLAHELMHLALAPLPLPLWLNEGVAQMMQEVLLGAVGFRIDHELVQRHQALWRRQGLQKFWTGESFDGEDEELSYHLAEVLTRNIRADYTAAFIPFVASADWRDAGDAAASEALGADLGEIAARFLGPGDWRPQLIED